MIQSRVIGIAGVAGAVMAGVMTLGAHTLAGQSSGSGLPLPLHLSAVAQDLDRGLSTPLRITISRWSSEQVRDGLVRTLLTNHDGSLLEALRQAPVVGTIRTPTSLAWDLHFARQSKGEDGGWRVVLGTDRPIAFAEQWRGSRTLDYPFTVIELHLDDSGSGDGTLSFATKVIADKSGSDVVLENWGTQRTRLTQVRREND